MCTDERCERLSFEIWCLHSWALDDGSSARDARIVEFGKKKPVCESLKDFTTIWEKDFFISGVINIIIIYGRVWIWRRSFGTIEILQWAPGEAHWCENTEINEIKTKAATKLYRKVSIWLSFTQRINHRLWRAIQDRSDWGRKFSIITRNVSKQNWNCAHTVEMRNDGEGL